MEDILFKFGIFAVGLPSLYFLIRAKTFFRRLALLGTICGGVAVWLLIFDKEVSLLLKSAEWLGWVGVIGFVFLILGTILDWLFSGD